MGNFKKTINLGGASITIEVKEETPVRNTCRCATPSWQQPQPTMPKGGEGIMVAVQKPQREFYDYGWRGEQTFLDHSRKYANLEKAAKACDWPNDLIDDGTIKWPVPQTQPMTRRAPQANTCRCATPSWQQSCACQKPSQPQREIRQKSGIPPIGAKVAGYTWNNEVIYTL